MFPGFSGGPLLDASGSVLGVLSSHLGRGQTLAVPADVAGKIVDSLKAHGKVRRGYLGVGTQPVDLPNALRSAHNITQERGLLLVTVDEDGPAGKPAWPWATLFSRSTAIRSKGWRACAAISAATTWETPSRCACCAAECHRIAGSCRGTGVTALTPFSLSQRLGEGVMEMEHRWQYSR